MPVIENTVAVPNVAAGFHTLEIDDVDVVAGTAYNDPDTPENRIKMTLKVVTADNPGERFIAWMSPKLSDKATFGGVVIATLGAPPRGQPFDTDGLLGRRFQSMVSHNERGWPRLVPGTACAADDPGF